MSKSAIKKFRKNDYSDRDEFHDDPRAREFKRNSKIVERALRTKDLSALIEDEDQDFIDNVSEDIWKQYENIS